MHRIPSLDGLRAIAISLLVAGHWAELYYPSEIAGSLRQSGEENFRRPLRISDHDTADERVWEELDYPVAQILCAARIGFCPRPWPSGCRCL
jgi:hypothetical protein